MATFISSLPLFISATPDGVVSQATPSGDGVHSSTPLNLAQPVAALTDRA